MLARWDVRRTKVQHGCTPLCHIMPDMLTEMSEQRGEQRAEEMAQEMAEETAKMARRVR